MSGLRIGYNTVYYYTYFVSFAFAILCIGMGVFFGVIPGAAGGVTASRSHTPTSLLDTTWKIANTKTPPPMSMWKETPCM